MRTNLAYDYNPADDPDSIEFDYVGQFEETADIRKANT